MANITNTTATTAGFLPQYWANRALDVLRANIVLARLVATDSDFGPTDFATKGTTLTIPYPGTFTAVDKTAGTPLTPQAPAGGSSVALTLNKHKSVPFLVEDFAAAQANLSLMDRYLNPATIAIVEQLETDLFALNPGFITSVSSAGTPITAPVLRTVRKTFNDQKAPMQNRSLVVSTADEIAILGDSTLQSFFAFAQPGTVKEGSIGRLYGIDVYVSQLVPATVTDVYTITLGAGNTGGTFTVSFNGQTTAGVAFNATGATLQTAFVGLSTVGAGNATVSGAAGGPYTLTLTGTLQNSVIVPTASGALLTGGAATATVAAAGTANNKNLAIVQNSILLATRPFAPVAPDMGVMTATAVDPTSGLSIRISAQYDINNVGVRVNVDILYGAIVLRSNQGMVVES